MRTLRKSSQAEYFKFYLERECRKRGKGSVPATDTERCHEMVHCHLDKVLPYPGYRADQWCLVELDWDDFGRLLFYDDAGAGAGSFTRPFVDNYKAEVDYRLLRNVGARSEAQAFVEESHGMPRHYYLEMQRGKWIPLQGDDKIALRTLVPPESELNPSATFYVHDGAGRSLAYMVLLLQGKTTFEPVEAFLCEQEHV